MRIGLAAALLAAAALSAARAEAGPCAGEITAAQNAISARLDQLAARGKPGAQSTFATTHHQPTPGTVAGAEAALGDISEAEYQAVQKWMAEARKDDAAGNREKCQKDLAQARGLLGM